MFPNQNINTNKGSKKMQANKQTTNPNNKN